MCFIEYEPNTEVSFILDTEVVFIRQELNINVDFIEYGLYSKVCFIEYKPNTEVSFIKCQLDTQVDFIERVLVTEDLNPVFIIPKKRMIKVIRIFRIPVKII